MDLVSDVGGFEAFAPTVLGLCEKKIDEHERFFF